MSKCRACGCTDEFGCEEGCSWVEADLCSSCVVPDGMRLRRLHLTPGGVQFGGILRGYLRIRLEDDTVDDREAIVEFAVAVDAKPLLRQIGSALLNQKKSAKDGPLTVWITRITPAIAGKNGRVAKKGKG